MTADLLNDARDYLVTCLQGKPGRPESRHPWRKGWQFAVSHSLRVEQYALRILERQPHHLSGREVELLRLAAILHDIGRFEQGPRHAKTGAQMARTWLASRPPGQLTGAEIDRAVGMIAAHSDKDGREHDLAKAVLQDADSLDEIGAMSIFMAGNWLDRESPFFFQLLRQRLVQTELPYCDELLARLNTHGARAILKEKRQFIEGFIAQLDMELLADERIERPLMST